LAHCFPYDVKLGILADSRSFLANQKARNAIVGAENLLIVFISVELRALLISGPPSRVRKVRSCKVEILIYAWNERENSLFAKLISQKRIR